MHQIDWNAAKDLVYNCSVWSYLSIGSERPAQMQGKIVEEGRVHSMKERRRGQMSD